MLMDPIFFVRMCSKQTYDVAELIATEKIPDRLTDWMMREGWLRENIIIDACRHYEYAFPSRQNAMMMMMMTLQKNWKKKEGVRHEMKRKHRANDLARKSVAQSIYLWHFREYQLCRKEHEQIHIVCMPCVRRCCFMCIYRVVSECTLYWKRYK